MSGFSWCNSILIFSVKHWCEGFLFVCLFFSLEPSGKVKGQQESVWLNITTKYLSDTMRLIIQLMCAWAINQTHTKKDQIICTGAGALLRAPVTDLSVKPAGAISWVWTHMPLCCRRTQHAGFSCSPTTASFMNFPLSAWSLARILHVSYVRVLERASPSVTPPSPAIGHFRCTCLTHLPITRFGYCAPRWRLPVLRIIHLRIWNLNMTIFQSFELLRRQTRSSRAGLSCSQWDAETVSPWFLGVRSRVRCQSKGAVLSDYGHREQDQFLEEKRKGSWKVSFGNLFIFSKRRLVSLRR